MNVSDMLNVFNTENNESNNSPSNNKVFHRKIYYQCRKFLDESKKHVCFLYGPRKIGKTYCLKQICNDYNAIYYDMKKFTQDNDKYLEILDDINSGINSIIIIDEVTYIEMPDDFISSLYDYFMDNSSSNVKVIITGSQAFTIRSYADSFFGGTAEYIQGSFIDFEEWLVYRGRMIGYGKPYDVTEDDYLDYIKNSKDFSGITSNNGYLLACITETIQSNKKSLFLVNGLADVYKTDLDNIIGVAYTTLLKLHSQVKFDTFLDMYSMFKKIRFYFNHHATNKSIKIKDEDFNRAVEKSILQYVGNLDRFELKQLREYLKFLLQCDLVVITKKSSKLESSHILDWVLNDWDIGIRKPIDFFNQYNVTFKYPLFYYNILDSIASKLDNITGEDLLSNELLGSMVECHVRGLLSYSDHYSQAIEFRDEVTQDEVDFVNCNTHKMIEISISNKSEGKLKFDSVPGAESYDRISLSKNWEHDIYVPYYKYILQLSQGYFIDPEYN
jgi:predicted AAA+ superfamily ATPase